MSFSLSGVTVLGRMKMRSISEAITTLFKGTVLLLKGQGANNAANNTFVDSSGNNFSVTRAGNTTQGSFTPFSTEAGYWSNYFDGSGDRLNFPNSSAFAFGTGSFTIEFWIYGPASNDKFILEGRNAITAMHITTGGYAGTTPSTLRYVGSSTIVSSAVIVNNTWNHCAIVRNGSSAITLYVNGVVSATGTDTTNYTKTTGDFDIGASHLGYLSNFRMVKGAALYTGAFTPPTEPLTAVEGTSLLTCQSNRFIDSSANSIAITRFGDTSVSPFSAFAKAEYTSAKGGSAYFDGSSDYLSIPSNSAFNLGTGDFTIEAWVYRSAAVNAPILDARATGTAVPYALFVNASNQPYFYDGAANTSSIAITNNAWNHVAVTRQGTSLKVFVNGAVGLSTTNSANLTSGNVIIGGTAGPATPWWAGYISNLRMVKGTAVYTAAFTPPTAPVTAVSGTSLLLNATNGAVFDTSGTADFETVGTAKISTANFKYGTSSMSFNGTTDYLAAPASNEYTFGLEDFTIEGWFNLASLLGSRVIISNRTAGGSNDKWSLYVYSNSKMSVDGGSAAIINGSATVQLNVWNHFVFQRRNGVFYTYLNGVQDSTNATSYNFSAKNPLTIGANPVPNGYWNGYLQDIRITKGVGLYSANFTPPTE